VSVYRTPSQQGGGATPSAATPTPVAAQAVVGVDPDFSRGDHVHPLSLTPTEEVGDFALTVAHQLVRIVSAAAVTVTLPDPASATIIRHPFWFLLADDAAADVTLARFGAETIQGLAVDYIMSGPWSKWGPFVSDGTNWEFYG